MGKKDIEDFLVFCGITATESTLNKIRTKIEQIDNFYKGKIDKLELKDIHGFFSDLNKKGLATSTKNDFIKIFKRFLRWKYKDWSDRFQDFRDIKTNGNDQRKLSKDELLTPDEMTLIFNASDSMKFKVILLLLQETACRPQELLDLTWKDVNLLKKEIKLYSSKTDKSRDMPIDKTIDHLKRYKFECFSIPPKLTESVFGINAYELNNHLFKIEEKLKFQKHLYPYLWRHTILSKMIRVLTPKVYEKFAGHSLETGMKIYAHLDNEDLREELNDKVYKIKELTKDEKDEIKELKEEMQGLKDFKEKVEHFLYLQQIGKFKEARLTKIKKSGMRETTEE